MDFKELRIGNYITISSFSDSIHTVSEISSIQIKTICRGESGEFFVSGCQGIPLTEEWLRDFGLKTYTKSSYNMAMGTIIITHPQSMQFVAGLDDLSGEFTVEIDLRYVHQLQNLYFALTGKELTK